MWRGSGVEAVGWSTRCMMLRVNGGGRTMVNNGRIGQALLFSFTFLPRVAWSFLIWFQLGFPPSPFFYAPLRRCWRCFPSFFYIIGWFVTCYSTIPRGNRLAFLVWYIRGKLHLLGYSLGLAFLSCFAGILFYMLLCAAVQGNRGFLPFRLACVCLLHTLRRECVILCPSLLININYPFD